MKLFGRFNTTRHLMIALVAALILSLLVPLTMQHAVAQTTNYTAVVTTPKLNVRSGPGAGYAVVTVAEQFTRVTLLGRNQNSSWAKIRLPNNLEGWGSTAYMESNVPWATLPVITEPGSPSEPTGFVSTGALNIRTGPGVQYPVKFVAGQGQALGLIGRDPAATWLEVRVNGQTGWAGAGFISTTYNIFSLPVTSGNVPVLPTATPTAVPTGAPASTPTPAPTSTVPTARVKSQRLNVRSGPGAGYSVLGTVVYWDVLTLIGRNANASWVKVRTPANVEGWVSSLYIYAPDVNLYTLPVQAEVVPSGLIVTGTANVRSGPGIHFTSIATLNYGTPINLVARNANVSWIKITVNGQTGWVGSDLIATDYNMAFLPVHTQ